MKKLIGFLLVALFVLGMTGLSSATQFQVSDTSTLTLTPTTGVIDYSYKALGSGIYDLTAGQSTPKLDLYSLTINYVFGKGSADADVYLDLPGVSVDGSGKYKAVGLFDIVLGKLTWNGPVNFDYGNGGTATLQLYDLGGINLCEPIIIKGKITDNTDSVPEPGTLFLLGLSLLGLGVVKHWNRITA